MKKDVLIRVKSLITSDDDTDRLEITTKGKLLDQGSRVFLTYKETDQNGYDGCSVLICVENENKVTISRSGDLKSQLVVEKGRRNLCSYSTPYGSTLLGITCLNINTKRENGNLTEIDTAYELDIDSSLISKNQLFIKIKECKN